MRKYNFDQLTWFDFEHLARDVVECREKTILEAFADGKDQGIDFRRIYDKDKKLVVQSKHYADYKQCIRELRKEAVKVAKLKPSRYILVLSLDLTPGRKEEIEKIFKPYIKNPSDIITRKDIESIVENNHDILMKNYKLWFTSASVLQVMMQQKIYKRSQFLQSQIISKAKKYVETDNINKALETLNAQNSIIISGIPGIGKTTLAEMLTLYHLEKGYSVNYVTTIDELEEALEEKEKQVIYYDDFLGRNFLNTPRYKNEDVRLVNIFERMKDSKNSRLIMTTREYILNQAENEYEALLRGKIDLKKIIIDLSSYTDFQKAQILYNHLYFSGLPSARLLPLIKNSAYMQIINHKNYNPRLIETIISNAEDYEKDTDMIDLFKKALDNPTAVWENAFNNHLSEASRVLLFALLLSPNRIDIEALEDVFNSFAQEYSKVFSFTHNSGDFRRSLKELDDTFIKIELINNKQVISFHNPSIIDFLSEYLSEEKTLRRIMIKSAQYLSPLVSNFSVKKNNHRIVISPSEQTEIYRQIESKFFIYKDVNKDLPLGFLNRLYALYYKLSEYSDKSLRTFLKRTAQENLDLTLYKNSMLTTYFDMLSGLKLLDDKIIKNEVRKLIEQLPSLMDLDTLDMLATVYEAQFNEVMSEDELEAQSIFDEAFSWYLKEIHEFDTYTLEEALNRADEYENLYLLNLDHHKERIAEAATTANMKEQDEIDRWKEEIDYPSDPIESLFSTLTSK